MADARLLQPAIEAARRALRLLDEEHVPAGLRRVVAATGRRLPVPLEKVLVEHLDRLEWLRAKSLERFEEADSGRDLASRLFLERPPGWEERIVELEAAQSEADLSRLLRLAEASNTRLSAKAVALAEDLRSAREEIGRLRLAGRADAERARMAEANLDLRARLAESERALAIEHRRVEELERLLSEADRRIAEFRRRDRVHRSMSPRESSPPEPRVFGAGDPLALARSLDHLNESLARVTATGPPEPVTESLALPVGIRPDQAPAIDWMLGVSRPLTVLIDGYNIGHELASIPDAAVRLRVEQVAARLRRLAEGPLMVVVFWDSRVDSHGWRAGGVDVRYVPSADEAIVEQSGPGAVVISSDRAVREAAEARGATGLWSQALLAWMLR